MHVGLYPYTADLLQLDSQLPEQLEQVDPRLLRVDTPLQFAEWEALLNGHPDREFVGYIVRGLRQGFRVGFNRSQKLSSAKRNMRSALEHPGVVQGYLDLELVGGRLLGPFQPGQLQKVHISKFGVIPKGHQPGKWRLIVDLSHPEGASVNDGIDPALCSLRYVRVDQIARHILELGVGSEMAKIDIRSAYRIIPVHPEDRHLLGMRWDGMEYVDAALPFGLRSAPKVFNAVADALELILLENGVRYLWHYLDDFITLGKPGMGECEFHCRLVQEFCGRLGVPLAEEKTVGPATCLAYLGIELDSKAMELRLPEDKLKRVREGCSILF